MPRVERNVTDVSLEKVNEILLTLNNSCIRRGSAYEGMRYLQSELSALGYQYVNIGTSISWTSQDLHLLVIANDDKQNYSISFSK